MVRRLRVWMIKRMMWMGMNGWDGIGKDAGREEEGWVGWEGWKETVEDVEIEERWGKDGLKSGNKGR
jgi:hypothetical protein